MLSKNSLQSVSDIHELRELALDLADLLERQPAGIYKLRVMPGGAESSDIWGRADEPPYRLEFVNQRFLDILGVTRQAFMDNPNLTIDMLHTDDRDRFMQANQLANQTLSTFEWEGRLASNGRHIHLESTPMRQANGDVIWSGLLTDISHTMQALEKLERAQIKLERANAKLANLAKTDGMTGLPNRRAFDLFFTQEWRRCGRSQTPLSVALIDVDFFKFYNDTLGHQQGDHCLERLGEIFHQQFSQRRPGDFVARYGGEEFVFVLSGTALEDAQAIAQDLRLAVYDAGIEHPSTQVEAVQCLTISVGVATVVPNDKVPAESLLVMADQALYAAKKSGRNRVSGVRMELGV